VAHIVEKQGKLKQRRRIGEMFIRITVCDAAKIAIE
jgi:hypothetical protein